MNNVLNTYNPSAILNIFNNALTIEATKKAFRLRGIYLKGKGQNYNGYYYDILKDEASEGYMTLIVPGVIRNSLIHEQALECTAYLTKKVFVTGGKIDIQANLIEVASQYERKITDEQIKSFKILQQKAAAGYKDVDGFIKSKIVRDERIRVKVMTGKNAIVDQDIKHQLKEVIGFFEFEFIKINLSNENEVRFAIEKLDEHSDIICISRGGGENMEIFNRPSLAEVMLGLKCFLITAIGHKEDVSLLQDVADKHFITPTALGQYFNDIYNKTKEELLHSKARMIEEITRQSEKKYEHQMTVLQEQLERERQRKAKVPAYVYVVFIAIGIALGVVIGKLLSLFFL